jgi:hypothetical protein
MFTRFSSSGFRILMKRPFLELLIPGQVAHFLIRGSCEMCTRVAIVFYLLYLVKIGRSGYPIN